MQLLHKISYVMSKSGLKHGNEYNLVNFRERELLKSICSCGQRFTGNDFPAFLAGKHRIKL